jgi:hypothetical protein
MPQRLSLILTFVFLFVVHSFAQNQDTRGQGVATMSVDVKVPSPFVTKKVKSFAISPRTTLFFKKTGVRKGLSISTRTPIFLLRSACSSIPA